MNDFSFDDSSSSEYNKDPGEKKKIIKLIIIVVVAAIVGFTVYFITDMLINGNVGKEPPTVTPKDEVLDLSDAVVKYLYGNVTYEVGRLRNDKFFKNGSVTLSDFSNQELFYYALRYSTESDFYDVTTEEEKKKGGLSTYAISNVTINKYMRDFFGSSVSYSTSTPVVISVNFAKDGFNAGTLKYDSATDSFLIQFDGVDMGALEMPINPYLYKFSNAVRLGANSDIVITEKVVFTSYKQVEEEGKPTDKYEYTVFKDYSKSKSLASKKDVSKSDLAGVSIGSFADDATTITYTFYKDDEDKYHFKSSKIE